MHLHTIHFLVSTDEQAAIKAQHCLLSSYGSALQSLEDEACHLALYRHAGCVMHCDRASFSPSQTEERSLVAERICSSPRGGLQEENSSRTSSKERLCWCQALYSATPSGESSRRSFVWSSASANALSACSEGLLTGESRSA